MEQGKSSVKSALAVYWSIGAVGVLGGGGLTALLSDAISEATVLLVMATICYLGAYLLIRSPLSKHTLGSNADGFRGRALALTLTSGGVATAAACLFIVNLLGRHPDLDVPLILAVVSLLGMLGAVITSRLWVRKESP